MISRYTVLCSDWVDRGPHQLECVVLLLALKISYPERVWLVRGNHEVRTMNRHYGFEAQCCAKLGPVLGMRFYELANSVFEWLPLAALVAQSVLVMHGGLGEVECRWPIACRCCKRPRLRTGPPTGSPSRRKEGAAVRKGARFALRCPRPLPLLNAASTVCYSYSGQCVLWDRRHAVRAHPRGKRHRSVSATVADDAGSAEAFRVSPSVRGEG